MMERGRKEGNGQGGGGTGSEGKEGGKRAVMEGGRKEGNGRGGGETGRRWSWGWNFRRRKGTSTVNELESTGPCYLVLWKDLYGMYDLKSYY